MQRAIVLIDGEHYPPVNYAGLTEVRKFLNVTACVFIGGTEKVDNLEDLSKSLETNIYLRKGLVKNQIPHDLILQAIEEEKPEVVYDLSDEPIVNYHTRFEIACQLFKKQVEYRGADFHFKPPVFEDLLTKPSISVFGTAKRIGKTSVAGYVARLLDQSGFMPLVITMGRGGPEEPEVVKGREILFSPEFLLEQSKQGKHACSDHWEDAYTSRVTTIGCRRCAGGMAGQVFISNVAAGAKLSNTLPENFTILEGSGATFPPVQTDKKIVIIGVDQPIEFIEHYFGPYRIAISDLAIITGCESFVSSEKIESLKAVLLKANPNIAIAFTVFRPKPMGEIAGKRVLLVTTAPANIVGSVLAPYLEEQYGCKVVGYSPHLSDRQKLRKDLEQIDLVDTVISEIKAAGVDVAASIALENNKEVVFMDNIPVLVAGGTVKDLDEAILNTAHEAKRQFDIVSKQEGISSNLVSGWPTQKDGHTNFDGSNLHEISPQV